MKKVLLLLFSTKGNSQRKDIVPKYPGSWWRIQDVEVVEDKSPEDNFGEKNKQKISIHCLTRE